MLPSRSSTLAGTITNNRMSLNIAQLGFPSFPYLVFYQWLTISTNTTNRGSALPGVGLRLLRSDPAALTTWLQIWNSCDHSTEVQTSYPTHEVLPHLRFNLPPRLRYFSQYSSPLMVQFLAEAMKQENNKMSSQTYPNSSFPLSAGQPGK